MTLQHFRELVQAEFGMRLEHATPELVQTFIARIYAELNPAASDGLVEIPVDSADNYPRVVGEFLAVILDSEPERAAILLWLFAAEVFYGSLGEQYRAEFSHLIDLPPTA